MSSPAAEHQQGPGRTLRPVQPHWLRRNEGSRTPHRVLFIDAETRPVMAGADETHELRWWHARHVRRHVERPRGPVALDYAGEDPGELAGLVDGLSIAKQSTWVYTHNLGFDLQVTRLPELLHAKGWQIVDIGITGRSPWIRMAKGRRRLVMADSTSWLPAPLKDVGEAVAIDKPHIADFTTATDEDIAVRCLMDTAILAEAMLTIMDWWDANDMGRWQWTGPGCGWTAFRHKFLDSKVLMDPEPSRLALERRAIYGGRREAWRIGDLGPGKYADLDFEAAYPTIASCTPLPRRPIARVRRMTREAYAALPEDLGVLSECVVTTDVPVVPCRHGGHVLYPVGKFTTVLSSPDIDGAIAAGATVDLGDTIIYQLEPYLAAWGKWVIGVVDGSGEQVPAVVRMWVRHTGRTVVGRWAMHAQRTEDWGDAAWPWFHAEPGTDLDTGCEVVDLHACGRHFRIIRDAEPENVFPAVTAYVEGTCRQLLHQAIQACPPGTVVQCDTDGFMLSLQGVVAEDARADERGRTGAPASAARALEGPPVPVQAGPLRIRVKGLYERAEILGPQQVVLGDSRRLSGVPRSFESADGLVYSGWTWPGYAWQLAHSQPGIYTRPHVTVPLRGPYGTRWVMADGTTRPPEMWIMEGQQVLLQPNGAELPPQYPRLAERQSAALLSSV